MKSNGFTLIEALTIVAIIVVLTTVAAPGLQHLLLKNLAESQHSQLTGFLLKSRTYAIRENVNTTICPTIDGNQCSPENEHRVMAFRDINKDGKKDDDEKLIAQLILDDRFEVTPKLSLGKKYLQYRTTGQTNGTAGSIQLCGKSMSAEYNRAVIISLTGRVRNSHDLNEDRVHELNNRGKQLCTS